MMRRIAPRRTRFVIGFAAILAVPASAQRPTLERVEDLTRLARSDEARSVLLEWWNSGRDDATRRELQRGLWLRGRLTVDPVQAELDFQRLVVSYPRGLFTPQAIMRLAQAAHAMGDEDGARGYVATLVRDYGNSPAREEAEAWLRAAGPAPLPPTTDDPPEEDEPSADDPDPVNLPAAAGNYFVQLGAFAEEARAMALYEEVRGAGIEVRVVRVEGSRFLHVRFGRFVERSDAVEELERLTEAGVNAALVRDERAEELVRG